MPPAVRRRVGNGGTARKRGARTVLVVPLSELLVLRHGGLRDVECVAKDRVAGRAGRIGQRLLFQKPADDKKDGRGRGKVCEGE
jgi:hypothetical protein